MSNRSHARRSPSGAHRWMVCPGSVKLEDQFEDEGSSYAAEGTAAHDLAELCLRTGTNADTYLGEPFGDYKADHEMVEGVQMYLDYVRGIDGHLFIEQQVSYAQWDPEGYGTSDAIVIKDGVINIIDFKYGKGKAVSPEDNPQGMCYALGAVHEFSHLFEYDKFRVTIVQPRKDAILEWPKADEPAMPITYLINWANNELKPAALATEQEDAPFVPGEKQCQFCKAKASCRAFAEYNFKAVCEDFEGIAVEGFPKLKEMALLTKNEMAIILDSADTIKGYLKALEANAYEMLTRGEELPGYKLVNGRSVRKWRDEEDAEMALRKAGFKVADIIKRKLITAPQAEKLIGKDHRLMNTLVHKPEGAPTLARDSDPRPAINMNIEDEFKDVA